VDHLPQEAKRGPPLQSTPPSRNNITPPPQTRGRGDRGQKTETTVAAGRELRVGRL